MNANALHAAGGLASAVQTANPRPAVRDGLGVETSCANPRSLETYARALRAFNAYRGDPVAIIDEALARDPDFVMGHVLRGHVHVSLWERSVVPEVRAILARLKPLEGRCNEREKQHVAALRHWARGDWERARITLDLLCADHPRDLLALQSGHLADFFHGDRDNLRGRIARALPAWTPADPGYGFLLGMHAFGLEECGDYTRAEETGRHALELEPDDCWGHHAVTHVMEMQTRQDEGIAFMAARERHWAQADNTLQFHNWWHLALFHLDQGTPERALGIYDSGVRAEPEVIQMMLLDAVALLWRMHLLGADVAGRFEELADCYENDGEAGFYAFNDMHAMMAFAATGRSGAAARRLAAITAVAEGAGPNGDMSRIAGLPVARGIDAFAHERYAEAVEHLLPVRYRVRVFGGSHAQRDVVHRTLIEAAMRDGNAALARALVNERASLRPRCPFSRKLARRASTL